MASPEHRPDAEAKSIFDETTLQSKKPEIVLRLMLSTMSCLRTSAEVQTEPKQIGKGQCGTIWNLPGTNLVLKVANRGKEDGLKNDFSMHQKVEKAWRGTTAKCGSTVHLPRPQALKSPSDNVPWDDYTSPPTYGLLSERIYALPALVREAIFDYFAPKALNANKQAFLQTPENQDCLIRIYLGRRAVRNSSHPFKLRNFDLMVNEMEALKLDTVVFAKTIAQGLARIHWVAGIDANDIEWVFGTAPPEIPESSNLTKEDSIAPEQGAVSQPVSCGVWVLDFDQCRPFPASEEGVEQLQRGFYFNDPYYPRPSSTNSKDKALWQTFKEAYLTASRYYTKTEWPHRFIDAVEVEGRRRRTGGSLFQ